MTQQKSVDGPQAKHEELPPPSYEAAKPLTARDLPNREQEETLTCIFITLSRENTLPSVDNIARLPDFDTDSVEELAERVRNAMLFTLAIDYGHKPDAPWSQLDHNFFMALGRWLIGLYNTNARLRLSRWDLSKLTPHLYRYVYACAHRLSIPIDIMVVASVRYLRAVERHGAYKPCTMDILRENGVACLAEKLYFDRKEILGCTTQGPVRTALCARLDAISHRYFDSIGLQTTHLCDTLFGRGNEPRIPFTLNQGGKEYEATREKEIQRSQQGRKFRWLIGLRCIFEALSRE